MSRPGEPRAPDPAGQRDLDRPRLGRRQPHHRPYHRDLAPGASALVEVAGTTATVTGLADGTPYSFTVHAWNAASAELYGP